MINKLKPSTKLYLLVLVMSVFIIGIGVYGINELKKLNQNTQTLYADRVFPMDQLGKVRYSYAVGLLSLTQQVQSHRITFNDANKQLQLTEKNITENWANYMLTYQTPKEKQLAKEASLLINQSKETIKKLKIVLSKEDMNGLQRIIYNELYNAVNPIIEHINELISLQVIVSGELLKNNNDEYNNALKKFTFIILLCLGFALPFSHYLVKNVKGLIKNLRLSNDQIVENQDKYYSLIEHAGAPILLVNNDTSFNEVNTSACQLLGYTHEEFMQLKVADILVQEEIAKRPLQWDAVRTDIALLTERKLRKKDGSTIEVELNTKILDKKGYLIIANDITERKKAENKLNEYKHFFINSNDFACVANVNGYIEMLNPPFEKILGYSEEELISNQFYSFIHPDDIPATTLEIEKLKTSGNSINFANRYRKKNGEYLWLEWNTFLDTITGKLYAIARNITERKHTENLLIESEKKYRNIFENVQDVFYQSSIDGIILDVSPSIKNHLGYAREQLIGKTTTTLYYKGENREKLLNLLKEKGEFKDYEVKFKSSTGDAIFISLDARLIFKNDGSPSHIDGSFKNITDHKRIADELIEHKEHLAMFIEHSPASLAMFDNEMNYIATSKRWINDYNVSEQELTGKNHYEVFPEIPQRWKDIHQRCLKGAIEVNEEDSFVRADGSTDWIRWEIRPWHKVSGKIGGIIMFTEVITERKNADTIREKITTDIIQRNKDLEQFSYIVSHNLRLPVANILGLAKVLKNDEISTDLHQQFTDAMLNSVTQLDNVVSDLNHVLQVRREINEKKETISFTKIVKNISVSIQNLIEEENTKINVDFSAIDQMVTIKSYIHSVFYNLITNSIKYRQKDIPLLIEIRSKLTTQKIILTFKDNGSGIDLVKNKELVFMMYKRFHQKVEGKGMGLFMVKTQLETLGGTIKIASEVNKGTKFTIEFALA